jgi:hypothetical protein
VNGNLTWRDETGEIVTKATKAQLAKRLYKAERFLWACTCCNVEKNRVSTCAKLLKTPHVVRDASVTEFFKKDLSRQIEQYRIARQKRDSMFAVLTKGADESDDLYEGSMPRPMSREQANRLLTVLKDNGIEDDECLTVAEAICFVTDLDETILQEVE